VVPKLFRRVYVFLLALLGAAAQQNDKIASNLAKVHSVSRPEIHYALLYPTANTLDV
jgi:hypothetical protein